MSCCGRGGSWFKNCGGGGNTKLRHTWYEGIQACKARSKFNTGMGQQLNGAQQKDIDASQSAGRASYRAVIAAANTITFMSVNTSTPMSDTTPIVTSSYTPDMSITKSTLMLMNTPTNILMTSSTHTSASTSITPQNMKIHYRKPMFYIHSLFIIVFVVLFC